jgi:hypothetical protein
MNDFYTKEVTDEQKKRRVAKKAKSKTPKD